ncbi:MAG: hypothetical protein M3342_00835, partial [Bacteroidota bacterium]|nr:hypothetical protein [Bacteroidota bacterium]
FIRNVRNYCCDVPTCLTSLGVIQGILKGADAQGSGGRNRSSVEASVMEVERRVQLIHLH